MSAEIGGLLLQIAASNVLPVLLEEAGKYFVRHAVRRATKSLSGQPVRAYSIGRGRLPRLRLLPSPSHGTAATVVSAIPGRVRFSVKDRRGDATWASATASALRQMAGVRKATVSTTTGSVLVEYEPGQITVERIRLVVECPALEFPPRNPARPERHETSRARRGTGEGQHLTLVAG